MEKKPTAQELGDAYTANKKRKEGTRPNDKALARELEQLRPKQREYISLSGKDIDVNGRSECAFSGYNDLDGDPRDPGWISQNYGQNVRLTPLDPSTVDPNSDAPFVPIPGAACNPNRGRDLHAE
jgi:hypothetical protein